MEHIGSLIRGCLGEFTPRLEDVAVMTWLPIFGDRNAIGVILEGRMRKYCSYWRLLYYPRYLLNPPMHLDPDMRGRREEEQLAVEALLSYWLSWFVLSSGPEDGINPFMSRWPSSSWKERGWLWNPSKLVAIYSFGWVHQCNTTFCWQVQCSYSCWRLLFYTFSCGSDLKQSLLSQLSSWQ